MINKKVSEKQVLRAFLRHYFSLSRIKYEMIDDSISAGPSPDAYVKSSNLLIEISRIVDEADAKQSANWVNDYKKISEAIENNAEYKKVKGQYLVSIPSTFPPKTNHGFFKKIAKKVIESINSEDFTVKINDDAFLEISKISEKGRNIGFSSSGTFGWFDPAKTVYKSVSKKLEKGNKQLSFKNEKIKNDPKKIILFSNQYALLHWSWDLFTAFSYAYEDLINNYKSIDEIWIQYPLKNGGYSHQLVYKRDFFTKFEKDAFKNLDMNSMNREDFNLFSNWFSPLSKLDEKNNKKLVDSLKFFLNKKKPHEIFKDENNRIEMVRLGQWLAKNDFIEDAILVVDKFITDPSPGDNPNGKSTSDFELHERVKNSKKADIHSIQTVRGHLAWTVQQLALKKESIEEAFNFTSIVLSKTNNLYLILQWLFPLMEISKRRFWLEEINPKIYKKFRTLCFSLLENNSIYPDIAKALVHIFSYFRDLTTLETKKVLTLLQDADGFETLLIYFGLYREKHFTEDKYQRTIRDYDSTFAKEMLLDYVINSRHDQNIRSGIARNICTIILDSKDSFYDLSPLIDNFLKSNINQNIKHSIERVIEDILLSSESNHNKAYEWYVSLLTIHVSELDSSESRTNIWLSTKTGEILQMIAKNKPEDLKKIISLLYSLWINGAYIGSINEVFTSYKEISDQKLKVEIKENFKNKYMRMKKINEKIEEVTFD